MTYIKIASVTTAGLIVAGLFFGCAPKPPPEVYWQSEWMTDVVKAQEKAKAENKLVLLNFTGSDWCPPCIKLKKNVFDTQTFREFVETNLVLVEVDFPKHKKLSAEQARANEALEVKYGVEGYPTIIVLNPDGKRIGELDYMRGGPARFIKALRKLME